MILSKTRRRYRSNFPNEAGGFPRTFLQKMKWCDGGQQYCQRSARPKLVRPRFVDRQLRRAKKKKRASPAKQPTIVNTLLRLWMAPDAVSAPRFANCPTSPTGLEARAAEHKTSREHETNGYTATTAPLMVRRRRSRRDEKKQYIASSGSNTEKGIQLIRIPHFHTAIARANTG